MRGEYLSYVDIPYPLMELPPHARRILFRCGVSRRATGTTSACAENTPFRPPGRRGEWNYLRMRGEYLFRHCGGVANKELPPHARRILEYDPVRQQGKGTTSACAENTDQGSPVLETRGNYLRMRGEYSIAFPIRSITPELPPHARRIPWSHGEIADEAGTTSACAENTVVVSSSKVP